MYPDRLVPNSKQIKITTIDKTHYLCRWVDPKVQLKDSVGKLNAEAIRTNLFDISTNKIPYSEIEHVFIKVLDENYNRAWNEGESGLKIPNEKFTKEIDRKYFFLKIRDILDKEGKFPFPANSEGYDYKFISNVKHSPTVSNYYHCILFFELFNKNEEPILNPTQGMKDNKILKFEIRQLIINNAIFEI